MYLADYHTHSLCSPDGCAPLTDLARAAVEVGLDELCLTDHCDLLDMKGQFDGSFDWVPVEEQLAQARPEFQGRLTLRKGLELGEAWEDPELARRLAGREGVDFVIGSVHNLSRAEGGVDFYFVHYDSAQRCHQVLRSYFNCMEALSRLDCFDVLGHIIYPLRYMNGRDGNQVGLEPYYPQLETIFRNVISTDRGIELNTCRGTTIQEWRGVLGLYRDCGGRLITLGSDAHEPKDVGKGIREGAELLQEFGFPLATYQGRQPLEHKG